MVPEEQPAVHYRNDYSAPSISTALCPNSHSSPNQAFGKKLWPVINKLIIPFLSIARQFKQDADLSKKS
jgi:hypothetical protein